MTAAAAERERIPQSVQCGSDLIELRQTENLIFWLFMRVSEKKIENFHQSETREMRF